MEDINFKKIISSNYYLKLLYKYRFAITFFIIVILAMVSGRERYRSVLQNGKYTIGVTIDSYYSKNGKKEILYKYYVNGSWLDGWETEVFGRGKDVVVPKGYYVVVYDEFEPKNSILLIEKPIENIKKTNLDSIRNMELDQNDVKWFYF